MKACDPPELPRGSGKNGLDVSNAVWNRSHTRRKEANQALPELELNWMLGRPEENLECLYPISGLAISLARTVQQTRQRGCDQTNIGAPRNSSERVGLRRLLVFMGVHPMRHGFGPLPKDPEIVPSRPTWKLTEESCRTILLQKGPAGVKPQEAREPTSKAQARGKAPGKKFTSLRSTCQAPNNFATPLGGLVVFGKFGVVQRKPIERNSSTH